VDEKALIGDHFTIGAWKPTSLSAADGKSASYIVAFDVPASISAAAHGPREQWDNLPSVSANYAAGRDAIDIRVRRLVDSLKRVRNARDEQ
jgi:hypothetical protein